MLISGNPKVFGPVFCFLVMTVSLIGAIVCLINNPVSLESHMLLQNEMFWRALGLCSIALLNLGALVIHRIFRSTLILPLVTLLIAIFVSINQDFKTNLEILIFLSIFTLLFSIATASARNLDVKRVSKFGIYEVNTKKD